jgi:hypothetical protein
MTKAKKKPPNKKNESLKIARGRKLNDDLARKVISNYYRDDPEGYRSDLKIFKERGETLQQWAEQILDETP